MKLYHADIKLPDGFVKPTGRVGLTWTRHALRAATDDRYGNIPIFKTATLDNLDIIEVGTENDRVVKIVFRGQMDAERDLVMVLIPDFSIYRGPWTVKTVWINEHNDKHSTLDHSKYQH